jgi:hypothetical protein
MPRNSDNASSHPGLGHPQVKQMPVPPAARPAVPNYYSDIQTFLARVNSWMP